MQAMTNAMKGSIRDRSILETIELCGVMSTDQLTELFFKFPSGKRKCQARMKSLYDRKLVKRTRLSLDAPTVYYQGKYPGQIEHSLALSWVYVWFMRKQGETVLTWETEELKEFGLRVDALCSTKILMTGEIRWYCIEIDRGSVSRHKFRKIDIYDDLYLKEGVAGSKLMKKLGNPARFPKVIIVTDDPKHGQKIRRLVAESKTKVRYEVHLLSAIKEGLA
ncbi:MAG: hypothetical protein HGJ97_11685 [Desulfosporosinus sp.]|nr:hypothetical protein [Desulfosporosinus sp.]